MHVLGAGATVGTKEDGVPDLRSFLQAGGNEKLTCKQLNEMVSDDPKHISKPFSSLEH